MGNTPVPPHDGPYAVVTNATHTIDHEPLPPAIVPAVLVLVQLPLVVFQFATSDSNDGFRIRFVLVVPVESLVIDVDPCAVPVHPCDCGDHIVILLTVPSLMKIKSGDVVFTAFLTVPAESVTVATAVEATVNVLVVTEYTTNCPL